MLQVHSVQCSMAQSSDSALGWIYSDATTAVNSEFDVTAKVAGFLWHNAETWSFRNGRSSSEKQEIAVICREAFDRSTGCMHSKARVLECLDYHRIRVLGNARTN